MHGIYKDASRFEFIFEHLSGLRVPASLPQRLPVEQLNGWSWHVTHTTHQTLASKAHKAIVHAQSNELTLLQS